MLEIILCESGLLALWSVWHTARNAARFSFLVFVVSPGLLV